MTGEALCPHHALLAQLPGVTQPVVSPQKPQGGHPSLPRPHRLQEPQELLSRSPCVLSPPCCPRLLLQLQVWAVTESWNHRIVTLCRSRVLWGVCSCSP